MTLIFLLKTQYQISKQRYQMWLSKVVYNFSGFAYFDFLSHSHEL